MKPNRPSSASAGAPPRPLSARNPERPQASVTPPSRPLPQGAAGDSPAQQPQGNSKAATVSTPRQRGQQQGLSREQLHLRSVGNSIDDYRPSSGGATAGTREPPAPPMYAFDALKDMTRHDVGIVPDKHTIFVRPSSAKNFGARTEADVSPSPLHPRPPAAATSQKGAKTSSSEPHAIPPPPIAFDNTSEYTFGTATVQLQRNKEATQATATPASRPASASNNVTKSFGGNMLDPQVAANISGPSAPLSEEELAAQVTAKNRPSTAKRPQTAKAAFEVDEAFSQLHKNVHGETTKQLTRPNHAVAPNDQIDIGAMRNFEDVVAYYAKSAKYYTPVKFVHMKRPIQLPGQPFRPYDLRVVSPDECTNGVEHYVVSNTSVVYMCKDHPGQTQTVSQFTQEASLFAIISKIKFFKTYLLKKMFAQWEKNIRIKLFCGVRSKLAKKFFVAKKTFAKPIREFHSMISALQAPPLVKLPHVREGLSLERFSSAMMTQKMIVLDVYRVTMEAVEVKLGQLVAHIRSAADIPDFASQEAIEQYVLFMEDQAAKRAGGSYNPNSIPITQRKENLKRRLSELKAALEEYNQLVHFVRLIDYMAAETMFYKALSSIQELNADVTRRDDEKTLYFLISVTFGEQGVVFVPGEEELQRITSDVAEELIATSVFIPRLISSKLLRGILEHTPKLQSLSALLRDDARVLRLRASSKDQIESDFHEGQDATKHFGKNRKWLEFVNKVWPTLLGNWSERFSAESLVKEFLESREGAVTNEEFVEVFRKAEEAFASLKEMHAVRRGCLVITSTVVLDFLVARLKEITVECREKLLAVAKSRLDRVAITLNARIKALQERPGHLNKFASFVCLVNQQATDAQLLFQACEDIEQLYVIAEMNGCEPGQEAGRRELVLGKSQDHGQSIRGRFEEATHSAKEFIHSHMSEMTKKLAAELEAEADSVSTYATLAESQILSIYNSDVSDCINFIAQLEDNIAASEAKVKTLLEWQKLFDAHPPETSVSSLSEVKGNVRSKKELWQTIAKFNECRSRCYNASIAEADVPLYSKEIDELYGKTYNKLHPKHQCDASERLLEYLREEKILMPTLANLGNKNLKREHWAKILANQSRTFDPSMTLEAMRHMKLFDVFYREVINEQSSIASGEANLLSNLDEIKRKWGATQFQTKTFRDLRDHYILDDVSDIIQQLEEHQLLVQACLASRFVSGVRSQVEEWERRLHLLGQVLDEWITVQNAWMYLTYIFLSEDMKRQLPTETSMFKHVDASVRELVHRAQNFKNCIVVATDAPVLDTLKEARTSLDAVHKRLEEYLETKRMVFPRFYFLSNDELLSILSDVRNPKAVRPHLRKCFDSVNDLIFRGDSNVEINGVVSFEGEIVAFPAPIFARGNVEMWLGNLANAVVNALKVNMVSTLNGLHREDVTRRQWLLSVQQGELMMKQNQGSRQQTDIGFPAQCVQAVDAVQWAHDTEVAISNMADIPSSLKAHYQRYLGTLEDTVKTVRIQLTPLQRSLIQTILVLNVHNRDVILELMQSGVSSMDDFTWRKQLRSYFDKESSIVYVEHAKAKLQYAYEYLGSAKRLVITPLTDRAFLTCTQALHLNLGGAPQGPAGTGKTESVKDLGKALARHVVVFNCSDGINTSMMSQMFAGLAQAGSWACFDEFNRIELEVLSVVAQQMLEITTAISCKQSKMTFDGHDLVLHPNFGVFVTMNPGYAGRTELPDNLQALFRPVCMMIPDYRLIAEIMFFSEGFLNAKTLSVKMVQLYKLSSEQLSKQDHYDFGMRAVKSILVMAGALKRAEPNEDEDMLLIRAMRDSNIPKFLKEDALLFQAIIEDLYPALEMKAVAHGSLEDAVQNELTAMDLVPVPEFVRKVIQLFETVVSRHGVMLVGATLSGKSTSAAALEKALTTLAEENSQSVRSNRSAVGALHPHYVSTTRYVMNPKSVSRDELYGIVNATTREWVDGILSYTVRTICNASAEADALPARHWICFDGPVDALWIENLNTVLDDNKMLCLVNGERIKLPDSMTFLFEVQDLRVASPATVSRCGMVYFDSDVLGWKHQLAALATKLSKKYDAVWRQSIFDNLVNTLVTPALEYLTHNSVEWIESNASHRVINMISLLDALLAQREENDDDPPPTVLPPAQVDEDGQELPVDGIIIKNDDQVDRNLTIAPVQDATARLFELITTFAFIWGIGGNQCGEKTEDGRKRFSTFVKELLVEYDPTFPNPMRAVDHTIYDACIHKGSLRWVDWAYKVPAFLYRRRVPFGDLLVATSQTVSISFLTGALLAHKTHVLVNGSTGTGKSVNVQQSVLLERLQCEDLNAPWQSFSVVLSAQTTGKQVQEMLETRLRKHPSKRRDQLAMGPPSGKTMVMFVDDLNMPACDEFGASPTLELFRQLIVDGGFYDKKKNMFKTINDVVMISCCGPPGGNRIHMSPRLTSRYFMLCQPLLNEVSVNRIFGSILNGFLTIFNADVRGMATAITKATLDVFNRVSTELLPTPGKAHYVFNMRDIGRVIQGITQTAPKECFTRNDILQLWIHESFRVFCDRLSAEKDRQFFREVVLDVAGKRFSQVVQSEWCDAIYADFTSLAEIPVYRKIEEGSQSLQTVLQQKLREYAVQNNKDLDLVMFDDAVKHLARLCRVLRQARGNALLVGLSGSGRQSLSHLAAFLCRCQRYQIQLTSHYDHPDFRNDLRKVLKIAGCDNEPVAFILSDNQITKEVFLEDINSILNTGEVTNLWEPEDVDRIISSTRERVRRARKPETLNTMMTAFVNSCRDNVHIVLTMSPMGADFFMRLRKFPSLINCTTIDWYDHWPSNALLKVATKMLTEALALGSSEDDLGHISTLADLFVYIHTTVEVACEDYDREMKRKAYCTPTSYIGLLHSFTAMLRDQREATDEGIQRFQTGLERLEEANRRVDDMKGALIRLQPELNKSTVETQSFAAAVEKEQQAAIEVAQIVAKEENQCAIMMREAQAIKDECQVELDKAMPAYNEALGALDALNPKDIQEAKAYTAPPRKVELVLDAVLTILDEATGWESAKRVLGRSDLINLLRTFDVNNVADKTLKKLKKYTEQEDFRPEAIRTVSKACVSFCFWCRAVENFSEVLKLLEPKKQRLAVAEAALNKAKAELLQKQKQLAEVEARLERLRQQYDDSISRLKQLEAEKSRTELHLNRAEKLLSGLSSEHDRWTKSIAELSNKSKFALSFTALASAFVAYCGVFDAQYRQTLLQQWIHKCTALGLAVDPTKPFSVQDIIDPVMIRHWNTQGLPSADFSVQNAVIVSKSARWCLCIDPHSQANTWIKHTYRNQGLVVLRMSDANLSRHLEVAVRGGLAVLIEDVDTTLDASLDPILRRETFRSGGRMMLTVRDQPVEYNPSFFLIMTTRLGNPHYLPEVHVKTTLLNFDVTAKGLEDQLLSEVVRCEKKELEEKADQLITQVSDARSQLKSIEDQILTLLSTATGNLLENDILITTLQQSKHTCAELTESLHVVEGTSTEIQAAREVYRPVAARGALVFSVIQQIGRLDHVYQTSLSSFISLFRNTILTTTTEGDDAARRKKLIAEITLAAYRAINRSLFEKDRPTYRFLLATAVSRSEDEIVDSEWSYMLRGSGGQLLPQTVSLPGEWLPDVLWDELQFLGTIVGFEELVASFVANDQQKWATLREDPFAAKTEVPTLYNDFSLWQKMLLMRTLNPKALSTMSQQYVANVLGAAFNESPSFDLPAVFASSDRLTPILFLLTPGTDPTTMVHRFAERVGMSPRLTTISLGQGQANRAETVLQKAMMTGQWIFLQNCHVYTSWLPQLARLVETLNSNNSDVHPDFRLWLTTMPTDQLPVSILQASVKVTREPPRGVRANLQDTLNVAFEQEAWKSAPGHSGGTTALLSWRKLLFSVAMMHAIAQERRKFGPLGWNVPYNWGLVDFETSIKTLQSICEHEAMITNAITGNVDFSSWDAVYNLLGDIVYGGRVTDLWDQRTLMCILQRVVSANTFSAGGALFTDDGIYRVPSTFDNTSLSLFVEMLPDKDPPELFGLHHNAEIRVLEQESNHLLRCLVEVQPKSGGAVSSGKKSQQSSTLMIVQEIAARMPQLIRAEESHPDTFRRDEKGVMSPLGTVASQEISRFNHLVSALKTQLQLCQLALKGSISMNPQLESLLKSLTFGQVPPAWEAIAYPSMKPLLSWVNDLIARVDFFRDWCDGGSPQYFWLGGFFFPQGFITALLQAHSRANTIPVDELHVSSFVTDEFDHLEAALEPLPSGAYVYGLTIEGARWNASNRCIDEFAGKEMSSAMPMIALVPAVKLIGEANVEEGNHQTAAFECPVYKVSSRAGSLSTTGISSNFILSLKLPPGDAESQHWVERGCALIACTDE